ncbi:MAG: hypothetical protein ABJM12_18655 [Ekhidna sp.]
MNLAELIIGTIKDEAKKTRQHMSALKDEIVSSIESADGRTFLEREVGESIGVKDLGFTSEPALEKVNPCQRNIATRKCPNASFDERDVDDWVRANFYKCTKIIELSRKRETAKEIAKTLNATEIEKVYTQANIFQIKCALKRYGYTKGDAHNASATDKLRDLRP